MNIFRPQAVFLPADTSPQPDTSPQAILNDRLAYWQEKLRLQDWRIEAGYGSAKSVGADQDAVVNFNHYRKEASVIIISQSDYEPSKFGSAGLYDPEFLLVHELLHLVLVDWSVQDGSPQELSREVAINILAGSLLDLDRRLLKRP